MAADLTEALSGETKQENPSDTPSGATPGKTLSPEAIRALEEAEARRKAEREAVGAKEINGPKGPEPTRYGDWERGGRAVDF